MISSIVLKFDGADADQHFVEARYLGKSLIGVDRIVNTSLVLLTQNREPRHRERFDFYVAARQPEAGSLEVATVLQNVPFLLPLVQEFIVTNGAEYVKHFLAWVLLHHGGRRAEGLEHMDKMIELVREMNRGHQALAASWQEHVEHVVNRLAPAAKEVVAPVGPSVRLLAVRGGTSPDAVVDEPTADAIRSKDDLEVADMQDMSVRVDGVIHHSRQMKIQHPDIPGRFITAEVRDPLFDTLPNPYMEAVGALSTIRVQAKPVYREGELHKIYIMNFLGEVSG